MTTPTHDDNAAPSIGYADQPPYATAPRDGLGWAALTVGIVALLLAVFFFPLGFVLALVGIGLGIAARRRAKRGQANNGAAALWGVALSCVALVLAAAVGAFAIWLTNETKDCNDPSFTEAQQQRCIQDELEN